jgi:hypothetical protein
MEAVMDAVVLILSDARGIYIPRDFLTDNRNDIVWKHCESWGLTEANKDFWIEATDPTYEHYWEDWDWILSNAKYTTEEGEVYLCQDLWALCTTRCPTKRKSDSAWRWTMSEPKKIRTTSDGCVNEHDVIYLSKKPKETFRVQSSYGPITRTMVRVVARGKAMLADSVTGTLYDLKTGRSNSYHLSIIGKIK